jgi:Na+/H+ antiporter NhaC
MTEQFAQQTEKKMAALESRLAPFFEKAPHLPHGGRKTLVDIAPWLALIFGILGIFTILSGGSFVSMLSFSFFGYGFGQFSMLISLAAGLIASVLELLAYQPLLKREKKGWNYLFYAIVISAAAAVFSLIVGYGYGMGGQLLGTLVGLWLLFEIRGEYR